MDSLYLTRNIIEVVVPIVRILMGYILHIGIYYSVKQGQYRCKSRISYAALSSLHYVHDLLLRDIWHKPLKYAFVENTGLSVRCRFGILIEDGLLMLCFVSSQGPTTLLVAALNNCLVVIF